MAIKVNGVTVIDDDQSAKFQVMNPGKVDETPGTSYDVGDFVYDLSQDKIIVFTGSEWK